LGDVAIRVAGLGKRYRIGAKQEKYKTIRDTLAAAASSPLRKIRSLATRNGHDDSKFAGRQPKSEAIWALKGVSFEVQPGDVVGVIGRNGAGKSTLLKILSRITEPTEGYADIHGRVGSLLEVGTGFHNELSGRENIYLNGSILGMKRAEIDRRFDEMVAFAEIDKFIDTPVKRYSTGMYLRLAFSVAAHLEPEILLVDEVLAVGDVAFQKKCLGKIGEIAVQGRTVLFVSHNMGAVRSLCNKGILLTDGQVESSGDLSGVIESYYRAVGALQNAPAPTVEADARLRFGPVVLNAGEGNTIQQSRGFQILTTLRIVQNLSGFSLYCILEDMQGRHVFCLREESPALGLNAVPAGDYSIKVTLPPLWLNPGLYSIYFKVLLWGEYAAARHVSDKFPLDVCGSNSVADAVLHPQANWFVH
jgi:lipopolysaccharide transport system ATP-binding protein